MINSYWGKYDLLHTQKDFSKYQYCTEYQKYRNNNWKGGNQQYEFNPSLMLNLLTETDR